MNDPLVERRVKLLVTPLAGAVEVERVGHPIRIVSLGHELDRKQRGRFLAEGGEIEIAVDDQGSHSCTAFSVRN